MAYPFDFIIKTGDTLPTLAAVLAGADGSPADLTDATVVFQMTDRATQTLAVDAAAVIVNAGAGSVQYNCLLVILTRTRLLTLPRLVITTPDL